VVEVRETEGFASKFRIDIESGKHPQNQQKPRPTSSAPTSLGFDCDGELPITKRGLELVEVSQPSAIDALSAFSDGPLPSAPTAFDKLLLNVAGFFGPPLPFLACSIS